MKNINPDFLKEIKDMQQRIAESSGPDGSLSRALYEHMKNWSLNPINLYPTNLPLLAKELAAIAEKHANR